MPKKTIQRFLPDPRKIASSKAVRMFGSVAQRSNLWHLNRRSASRAFAIGLFVAFLPVPAQMIIAAAMAIFFSANIPLSVALVWISNPITMPPLFYASYQLGALILGRPSEPFLFEPSLAWFAASLGTVVPPFLLGCLLLGGLASLSAFITIRILWRQAAIKAWRERQRLRASKRQQRNEQ
ncbi:DUF2062 domain-containing protein [Aliidiomarina sedimenti]|uniref:DUF2062 domain-containing protein n=1 Tax=Aliidiomarina sedimenti TaxID=1933879 RepID=A0ABY0C151_9GAMM|nr:DUF2062 domain-containing protein [Aliidiomarina sedimenti]RUO31464.1 DUF2062 domain-containing protein [Aliidiomarina sedimenti]